jgi:hypothetical protein
VEDPNSSIRRQAEKGRKKETSIATRAASVGDEDSTLAWITASRTTTTIWICDQLNDLLRMDASPLNSLPVELFFRILDFLKPHEYSGLSCTCRGAVALVNRKLDNPRDRQELYFGWGYFDDSKALHTQLPPCKSRTARYVTKEKRIELDRERRIEFQLSKERRIKLEEAQWAAEVSGWSGCRAWDSYDDNADL